MGLQAQSFAKSLLVSVFPTNYRFISIIIGNKKKYISAKNSIQGILKIL